MLISPNYSEEVIAFIPARGGSKSIPRKNIIEVLGKPLIAWSILSAIDSKEIDRVVVSTDDEEIAEISRSFGAEVPFLRPKEISEDHSTDYEVFDHYIIWMHKNHNKVPNLLVHLRPTGPARTIKDIDYAVQMIKCNSEADSLKSVSLAKQTPYKMWQEDKGYLNNLIPLKDNIEHFSLPRQLLPKIYWQNGYIDIVKSKTVVNSSSLYGEKCLGLFCNDLVHDVDYYDDIPIVEDNLRKILAGDLSSFCEIKNVSYYSV